MHTPGKSIELVLRELGKLRAAGKCDIAIIDYLEKAAPSNTQLKAFGANHLQREANDVDLLKDFSEEQGIPMFLLSQFNKFGKTDVIINIILSFGLLYIICLYNILMQLQCLFFIL
jgi:hypothetical protein